MVKFKKGEKQGRLTIISSPIKKKNGNRNRVYIKCKCDCGTIRYFLKDSLDRGAMSCGCLRKENALLKATKHGKVGTNVYSSWQHMKNRCLNKKNKYYQNYGGRGIKICKEWLKFENFYKDMGDAPKGKSIDRIDIDGDYCKKNCRWATRKEQANNTRRSAFLEYKGEKKTIALWARIKGIKYNTLSGRIYRGWSIERALNTKI